jgi:translation initiation factor eIF-2B subunit alpha
MSTQGNQSLYRLIRSYMYDMGTSRTTVTALKSYVDAVRRLKCDEADFTQMLARLNTVIKATEPRVIPLVHLVETFEAEMAAQGDLPLEAARQRAMELLDQKRVQYQDATARVTVHCMNCIAPGDLIVAHLLPAYIREALVRARTERDIDFRVLAVKHDFVRTRELIEDLEAHRIDHLLIPEYNLSHYLKSPAKCFTGAVSVTSDNQAVTPVGTANVVGLCHWYRVPVYLFVESIKFAHKALAEQRIYSEAQAQTEADVIFHMETYSHDFIDLAMIDHIFTEAGEIAGRTGPSPRKDREG